MNTDFVTRALAAARLIEALANDDLSRRLETAVALLARALRARRPVLICGNGGSSSDAMHIAGELVGRFLLERRAFNVIALSANPSVLTAWSNDYEFEQVFSRQVEAHAQAGGVVWGISTSGNSPNVIRALEAGKRLDMHTLALTGMGGGEMAKFSDVVLDVPSRDTPRIQEMHVIIYHFICEQLEAALSC